MQERRAAVLLQATNHKQTMTAKTFITDITVRATVTQAHLKCVENLRHHASASVIGLAMIRQVHPDRDDLRALEAWWKSIDEQAAAEMRRIKSQIEG